MTHEGSGQARSTRAQLARAAQVPASGRVGLAAEMAEASAIAAMSDYEEWPLGRRRQWWRSKLQSGELPLCP
jgi:hypothetical protein